MFKFGYFRSEITKRTRGCPVKMLWLWCTFLRLGAADSFVRNLFNFELVNFGELLLFEPLVFQCLGSTQSNGWIASK